MNQEQLKLIDTARECLEKAYLMESKKEDTERDVHFMSVTSAALNAIWSVPTE